MHSEKYVTEDEMLVLLRTVYRQPEEEQLTVQIKRWVADPVQPFDAKGRTRLHPLLIVFAFVIFVVVVALIYLAHIPL